MAQQANVEAASISHKHQKTPGAASPSSTPNTHSEICIWHTFTFTATRSHEEATPGPPSLISDVGSSSFPNSPGIKTTGSSLGACRPRFQPHSVTLFPRSGHQAVAHHVVPKTLHGKAAHATQILPFHAASSSRTQAGCSWDLVRGQGPQSSYCSLL